MYIAGNSGPAESGERGRLVGALHLADDLYLSEDGLDHPDRAA